MSQSGSFLGGHTFIIKDMSVWKFPLLKVSLQINTFHVQTHGHSSGVVCVLVGQMD